ncbi:MAG TPA: trehalose-phosphatase [Acinetobacter lwoffii]|uniref:trehalose-phosphatase n=1 Tax=Acinetobacter lwoffii TaxID=28090 RepID=UPI000EEDEDB4|nr:trehalose-phosphatase [Acinetobacter lwoffii]HCB31384.1 trehalose-phosphatase [Acinetobacter lwoffii]
MSTPKEHQDLEDSLATSSYILPQVILNQLKPIIYSHKLVLFLDIDGTISEFHPDPAKSIIKNETLNTLRELQQYIQLVLVTGRSIVQAQKLIYPFDWNIAGSHGLELSYQSRLSKLIDLNPKQFELLKNYITEHSNNIPQTRIEIKDYSVALHFREHPYLEHQVHAFALNCLTHFQDFELKAGKFVFELVPKGANKGSAIQQIIQQYHLSDHYPIFIGDDLTDEAGFQVINTFKGCSIKVGTGNTVAQHRLENVTQVQAFLAEFLEILKAQQQLLLEKLHVETHSVIKSCKST